MTERGGPPARALRARTLEPPVTRTPAARAFVDRHIGPRPDDVARMLERIGAPSLDALIDQAVPAAIRTGRPLDLPPARSEAEVLAALHAIADRNTVLTSMIGLGYHGTYTPAVIRRNVLENPGWYTSYTPYQPEISQGRLEALLNFQTVIADLTALPIAGASLLDEATAVTEAVLLMRRAVKGREAGVVVVDAECLPQTLAVLRGRADAIGLPLVVADLTGGLPTDAPDDVVGVVVQQPGASGLLRDLRPLIEQAHGRGALVTVAADLLSLALLTPPGELGADVAVGSAQRFGVPLFYGGPHAAYISVRSGLERMLPGRLVGVSVDADGAVAYRLALQTREQHIRREKATSNICTAQALLAVVAAMYAVYHGQQGLGGADVARRLLATDVLLTGLQGESVGHRAVGVDAHADQAAGQHPLQAGPHGDVGGMRAAVEQRDTEPLRGADGDIGAQLTGRRQQGQRQQVRGDRHQGATPVRPLIEQAHGRGALVTVAADLLSLALLTPPGELGAAVAVGSAQRFGVPLFYGGPHAAYISVRSGLERMLPGRLVGVSVDADGAVAYRLALQTREQHIRREKATSNICTAQALLAVVAAMYAVYHGPDGLRAIATQVHERAAMVAGGLRAAGIAVVHDRFFDTVLANVPGQADAVLAAALERDINLRRVDADHVAVSTDETTTPAHVEAVLDAFRVASGVPSGRPVPPGPLRGPCPVYYTHLRAHETRHDLVCR